MRCVVSGGQTFDDYAFVAKILDELHTNGFTRDKLIIPGPITELANGKCSYGGADLLSDYWCDVNGLIPVHFPALWGRYQSAAGPKRNRHMLREFNPDLLVTFPGGHGTANCIDEASTLHIPVYTPDYQ